MLGRLADRDGGGLGENEVDLLVVDEIFLRVRDRDQEDAENVVAMRFQLRPRVVLMTCRGEQLLESSRVDAGWQVSFELGRRRVEEVHPVLGGAHLAARVALQSVGARTGRYGYAVVAARRWCSAARNRSASSAAAQPEPAAVTACRYT